MYYTKWLSAILTVICAIPQIQIHTVHVHGYCCILWVYAGRKPVEGIMIFYKTVQH